MRVRLLCLLLIVCPSLVAAERHWTGEGGLNRNWTEPANWGGTAPQPGDDLVFNFVQIPGWRTINDFPPDTPFHSLTFLGGYDTTDGNRVVLGAGGLRFSSMGTILTLPIRLGADQTWTCDGFSIRSSVDLNGFALSVGGLYSGSIEGVISGNGSIIALGASQGPITFSGANTYSGPTTIAAGTLVAASETALGVGDGTAANGTTITNGSSLLVQTPRLAAERVEANGRGLQASGVIGGSGILTGPVIIGNDVLFTGTLTFRGAVIGSGSVDMFAYGTFVLENPANDFSAPTLLISGSLSVTAAGALPPDKILSGFGELRLNGTALSVRSIRIYGKVDLGAGGALSIADGGSLQSVVGTGSIRLTGGDLSISGPLAYSGMFLNDGGNVTSYDGGWTSASFVQSSGNFRLVHAFTSSATIQGGLFDPLYPVSVVNDLTLTSNASYNEQVKDDDHDKIGVRRVNLGNATLSFNDFSGRSTTPRVMIQNDGPDPVIGTFKNLPNRSRLGQYRLRYDGGDGNDVVLIPIVASTTFVHADPPAFEGAEATLTATVSGSSPSGTVTFFSNGARIGSAPLNGGVARLTTSSLFPGKNVITAHYEGDEQNEPSTSAAVTIDAIAIVPMLGAPALIALSLGIALLGIRARGLR